MTMRSELGESPAIVEGLLATAWPAVQVVAARVRERRLDLAVIAARGTSDHAAIYGQYILGARNGILVAPAAPSLVSLYGAPPRMGHSLTIGISQSGRSPDVVSVVEAARGQGALTVALTNDTSSALAEAAEFVVGLEAGREQAVAATKTYVAEVAVLAMLSAALRGDDASAAELRALPGALRAVLATEPGVADLAGRWSGIGECAVLARGFNYATAREMALKLKEVAYVLADPYSAADFQHGPIALVAPGFPVIAIATSGAAYADMRQLIDRLHTQGARLAVLTDVAGYDGPGDVIAMPSVPEWLSPIVTIVPGQLLAWHLAQARGLDIDHPRNITKVTLTH